GHLRQAEVGALAGVAGHDVVDHRPVVVGGGGASADRNVSPRRVTKLSGYAVNHTDARSTAARGSGCANGFCHMLPCPESCEASRFASVSIDSPTSQSTYSR